MDTLMRSTRIPSLRRMFEDFGSNDNLFDSQFFGREMQLPAVNIKENDKSFDIDVAAPGFDKGDFKLNIENKIMTISAERERENNEEKDSYTRKEFSYSSFSRSFTLPDNIKEDQINAKYDKGILHLTLHKSDRATPQRKTIPVE